MKKILYVFGGEEASGAEYVIQRLFKYNAVSIEPHLFVSPGRFADAVERTEVCQTTQLEALKKLNRGRNKGLGFITKALKNYLVVSGSVLKYIKHNNIDVVHANTVVPASYLIPAIIFSKITFKKTRWIWSDHDIQYFSKLDHALSNLCLILYDRTLVVSEAVKKKFKSNNKRLLILYNGIDLRDFKKDDTLRRQFREKYSIKNNELLFCLAGVVSPRKGQTMLVKVFSQLLTKYDNIKLICAGSLSEDTPSYYKTFLAEIEKYHPNITYVGKISDMVTLYNGIDILYNNSSVQGSEPLGTTILEAMAMYKVVIVSRVGGSTEIVSDNENGFIFAADDEIALSNITSHVIENWESCSMVGDQAYTTIKDKFDIKIMAKHYNTIITSII